MDLETMKKIIRSQSNKHRVFVDKAKVAERYFRCENDIIEKTRAGEKKDSPQRHAIYKIPSKFYNTIVNQQASYMFGIPPIFDLGNDNANKKIKEVLGEDFGKNGKHLCIDASNCTKAWVHLWITGVNGNMVEDYETTGEIEYGIVDPKEIVDVWGSTLDKKLIAVRRVYDYTELTGETYEINEWWDSEFCYSFRKRKDKPNSELEPYNRYHYYNTELSEYDETNVYRHGFDEVPFICFKNNNYNMNDLQGIKQKIDAYDEIMSGLAEDIEDIQEVIYILSGYGAEPSEDFLHNLKTSKLVKISSNGVDTPHFDTLTINIPVDAKSLGLETYERAIYKDGGGVDTSAEVYSYTSGEAMKYMYSLLELRTSIKEDEFRNGFARMIKIIANHYNLPISEDGIKQSWQRNRINNDGELVQQAKDSLGILSKRSVLEIHPHVEDVETELERIKDEEKEEMKEFEPSNPEQINQQRQQALQRTGQLQENKENIENKENE